MKLYDCSTAPSPRDARRANLPCRHGHLFLADTGIALPTVQFDLWNG
jgi:hypothetical protein